MHKAFIQFVLAVVCVISLLASQSHAQEAASLIADKISFSQASNSIRATGNVKIYYNATSLTAQEVVYDQAVGQITIIGPFTLQEGDDITLFGDGATLDSTLSSGMMRSVRLLMDQQLQIAAQEFQRTDLRFSTLQKVVASTCYVCDQQETPFWQIRAARVIHDAQGQRLYFEQARLDFLGFPIFYSPRLSIPEPGVTRATGFLVPRFASGNVLGVSAKLPFYWNINEHSDATFTPFITTKGTTILEGEYRKRVKNGAYQIEGALAFRDDLSNEGFNGYVKSDGEFALRNDFKLEFGIFLTSEFDTENDSSFLDNYDYSDNDRLNNFITVTKTTANRFVQLGASFTQSIRAFEVDTDVPVVLPEFQYTRSFQEGLFGGKLNLTAHSVSLIRDTDTTYTRLGGRADWRKSWLSQTGIIYGASAQLNAAAYYSGSESYLSATPILGIEARYPLQRRVGNALHVIEPIVQLLWAPDEAFGSTNQDASTSDSTTAEFEETNLFSINRFPGYDATEGGTRANIGVRYTRYDPSGWDVGVTVGRVFRAKNLDQFDTSTSTGLDNTNSDFVGALSLTYQEKFEFLTRMLVDPKLKISKNETAFQYRADRFSGGASYVWLDSFTVLGQPEQQHEASLFGSYQASDFWTFSADWRHNLSTGSPIEGNFGAIYRNECAEVTFSISLDYDSDGTVERDFGLQVAFAGLGARNKRAKSAHRCGL